VNNLLCFAFKESETKERLLFMFLEKNKNFFNDICYNFNMIFKSEGFEFLTEENEKYFSEMFCEKLIFDEQEKQEKNLLNFIEEN
jgi:hypothetical protein